MRISSSPIVTEVTDRVRETLSGRWGVTCWRGCASVSSGGNAALACTSADYLAVLNVHIPLWRVWAGGTLITERGSAFKKNKTKADRPPKPVPLPEVVTSVDIVLPGRSSVTTLAGDSWKEWFEGVAASRDFMRDREQPAKQERASP